MWKRGGGGISALDRAQALLSASRGGAEPAEGSAAKTRINTGAAGGSIKNRFAPPNPQTLLSGLSDLSSASSDPEQEASTVGSAAAAGKTRGRDIHSDKDLRPSSSLGGGGSRFLKKAPPPAVISSQSPASQIHMQRGPVPRNVSSSLRGSQTAALRRLAEIENRMRSHESDGQELKPSESLTSDLKISAPAAHSLEASAQLSAQSSSDQSLKGKRFLKTNTAVAAYNPHTAAVRSPQAQDVGARSRSRAADVIAPSKSVRVVSSVSLESDEEDMKKLLGDSLDLTDNFQRPKRPSSARTAQKMSHKSSEVLSTPPPAVVRPPPSSSSTPVPPGSPPPPSHRRSPFRFTGQPQAHFSPSLLSLSPSPPRASPSPPGRLSSPYRAASPQRSLSSMSGHSQVLSLEELFPVGPGSAGPHSETSEDSSEDFKIHVMTLDDLVPANTGFSEGASEKQREDELKVEDQQEEEEDVLDYQTDFESLSRTESDYSASQVSEDLQGGGAEEEEVVSEVRETSGAPSQRTDEDHSFSDPSRSYTSSANDHSETLSRSSSSRSAGSQSSAPARKVLREAAVQTHPDPLAYKWPAGLVSPGPAADVSYLHPTPVVAHTLSAEMVEALSTFNPATFALNEVLKQQLATIRRFIDSSRRLHLSLVRSLEPPKYRYTTLEDTEEYIRKRRTPKLSMEDALKEVVQEMRDQHHV